MIRTAYLLFFSIVLISCGEKISKEKRLEIDTHKNNALAFFKKFSDPDTVKSFSTQSKKEKRADLEKLILELIDLGNTVSLANERFELSNDPDSPDLSHKGYALALFKSHDQFVSIMLPEVMVDPVTFMPIETSAISESTSKLKKRFVSYISDRFELQYLGGDDWIDLSSVYTSQNTYPENYDYNYNQNDYDIYEIKPLPPTTPLPPISESPQALAIP